MKFSAILVSLAATLPSAVYAHGFLGQVAIDGKWYAGNVPNNYKGPSPIRLVNDIGPVKGSNNKDLICGLSAQNAEMVVPANPGSTVTFQWSGGGGQKWPHNTGPLMTYMASCGSTSCDKFDPTGAQWFKIDQAGRKNGQWVQLDIMQGAAYDVVLPKNLSPGGYLIRHEIIALHLGVTLGGAEFYPSCTQVLIGGNGNGSPSPTVSFPGAYSDNDPGIYDQNIYDPSADYVFPGGPISNLAASSDAIAPGQSASAAFPTGTAAPAPAPSQGGGNNNNNNGGGNGSPAPTPAPTQNPTGNAQNQDGGSGSCKLKKRSVVAAEVRPRHYSRIMRSLLQHSGSF
ncbi:glycosyl hydrolase family 61-domain-containing protein [Cristinia sonorae]|uniref:lytic cellulose monooxygenase (C4-dehydrogenating) n=1 Tax=Cristinia sonorae TaxID=1940300 RepID=A0A8K0UGT3_9AGAR|nr:glycosyl hydrolase family 61-domain-containing protein [Cristinia sonorae]